MSATPRDHAALDPWRLSIERSCARRKQTGQSRWRPEVRAEPPGAAGRDLADSEPWELSLGRSRARRRASQLRFTPARKRARRISLGTLVALTAAPAASYGDASAKVADRPVKPAAPPTTITHELELTTGSKGRQVRRLQKELGIRVDGIYGRETERAVRAFQGSRKLTVDNIVGPQTKAALAEHAPAAAQDLATSSSSSSSHVLTASRQGQLEPSHAVARLRADALDRGAGGTPAVITNTDGASNSEPHRERRPEGGTPRPEGGTPRPEGGTPRREGDAARREGNADAATTTSPGFSAFAMCVAELESGVHWRIDSGNGYEGAFQWLHSTWIAMGGGRFAARAIEATPAEQVQIFEENVKRRPGAWPTTVPRCLYLRSEGTPRLPQVRGESSRAGARAEAPSSAAGGASSAPVNRGARELDR